MIVYFKKCGGLTTIPRGGDSLGLATLFTRPRIVEGYTLYRFR